MTTTVAPSLARWLADSDPGKRPVQRSLMDAFIMESPPGSNRGATIDSYNLACGVPVGSPYCGSSAAAWWRDSDLEIPPLPGDPFWPEHKLPSAYGPASTDAWYAWLLIAGRFTSKPAPGYVVLYGKGKNPEHMAMIIRASPVVMTMEANTGLDGKYNREGVLFDRRVLDLKTNDRVIGFGAMLPAKP